MSIDHQGRITSSTSQTILQNRNGRVVFKFEATFNLILTLHKDSRKKKIIEQYPLGEKMPIFSRKCLQTELGIH